MTWWQVYAQNNDTESQETRGIQGLGPLFLQHLSLAGTNQGPMRSASVFPIGLITLLVAPRLNMPHWPSL
jgi:hypothetical protein